MLTYRTVIYVDVRDVSDDEAQEIVDDTLTTVEDDLFEHEHVWVVPIQGDSRIETFVFDSITGGAYKV